MSLDHALYELNEVKQGSILTDRVIGWDIKQGINKPKNQPFNDKKRNKNKGLFVNSTNGCRYDFSYDSSYDIMC